MKINIERMRKHAARGTPDVITKKFDPTSDTYDRDYHIWKYEFHKKMMIKHKNHGRIEMTAFQNDGHHDYPMYIVEARWVEEPW